MDIRTEKEQENLCSASLGSIKWERNSQKILKFGESNVSKLCCDDVMKARDFTVVILEPTMLLLQITPTYCGVLRIQYNSTV